MSESNPDAIAAAEAAQAEADAAVLASQTSPEPEPTAGETAAAEAAAAEAAAIAEAAKKPDKTERRIANLTRKMGEETRAREAAERARDAAEALLASTRTDETDKPLATPPARTTPATDVEAAAARLVADRAFNTRLGEIDTAGKKELGGDQWEAAKATLTGLGAVNNKAFLEALSETDNPAKIFAAMADDTDALMELLKQSPAKMATRLGRMDAEMSKPAAKPLSGAPKPGTRVDGVGVLPAVDLYDPKISTADMDKELDRLLPPHLGGKRRAA